MLWDRILVGVCSTHSYKNTHCAHFYIFYIVDGLLMGRGSEI
jgi:hypothetical protein